MRLHHYATLLAAELLFILVYPFFTGTSFRDGLFRLLALMVFTAAIYAAPKRGQTKVFAYVLGLPAIGISIVNFFERIAWLHTVSLTMGLVFLGFITVVFVWTILSDPSVTTDTLAGAVSAYLLIGITFGVAYTLVEHLLPGAFKDTIEPGKHLSQAEFTFFSFVTLTTVGYGDIVPWEAHARAIAIVESVIGVMYPAVLIGRLVGMHGHKRDN